MCNNMCSAASSIAEKSYVLGFPCNLAADLQSPASVGVGASYSDAGNSPQYKRENNLLKDKYLWKIHIKREPAPCIDYYGGP